MKNALRLTSIFAALCLLLSFAAAPSSVSAASNVTLTCTTADEWTDLFFRTNQNSRTWLGADGIYSASLDGNDAFASADGDTNTVFFFSDTLMGTSNSNGLYTGQKSMPSHTSALLTGSAADKDNLEFVYGRGGNMNADQDLFGERKWLLDCMVVGNNLYVFGFTPSGDWKPENIDMWTIPIENGEPKYSSYRKTANISQLWYRDGNTALYAYGIGIMCNTVSAGAPDPDGYIYIYGYRDAMSEWSRKDLIVSRIKETDFPDFSKLRYWDGENWVEGIQNSKPVLRSVSCEMSVTPIPTGPYKGKYIAIYTKNTEGAEVAYSISDTPYGTFSSGVTFYNCPEYRQTSADGKGWIYTYNAKAHPHLSQGDKLLVSYNCNARDCKTQHPADYHPRFLWLDLDPLDQGDPTDESSSNTSSIASVNVSSIIPSEVSSDTVTSEEVSSESTSAEISSEEVSSEVSSADSLIPNVSSEAVSSDRDESSPPVSSVGGSDNSDGSVLPVIIVTAIVAVVVLAAAAMIIIKKNK